MVTDIPSGQHDDPETQVFSGDGGDLEIRVTYPTHLTPLLGQYLDHAVVEEGGERSSAVLRVADEQALKRLAARRGGAVVIEEPEAARAAAVEWAEAGLAQYVVQRGIASRRTGAASGSPAARRDRLEPRRQEETPCWATHSGGRTS